MRDIGRALTPTIVVDRGRCRARRRHDEERKTMLTKEQIHSVADALRVAGRALVEDGGQVPPTVFIVARNNPITGEPADPERPIVPMVQPHTMSKERFGEAARAVAVAARAQAVIVCVETWHVRLNKPAHVTTPEEAREWMRTLPPPSQNDDRQETVSVFIESDEGTVTTQHQSFRRDEGTIVWDDVEELVLPLESRRGNMCILVDPKIGTPPEPVLSSCRNVAAYMLEGVDWVRADFGSGFAAEQPS